MEIQLNIFKDRGYFENYAESYIKRDRRKSIGAFKKFSEYTNAKPIIFKQITENLAIGFKEFLLNDPKLHWETQNVYFTQFKKLIKKANKEKILNNNPVTEVSIPITQAIHEDILKMHEIGCIFR